MTENFTVKNPDHGNTKGRKTKNFPYFCVFAAIFINCFFAKDGDGELYSVMKRGLFRGAVPGRAKIFWMITSLNFNGLQPCSPSPYIAACFWYQYCFIKELDTGIFQEGGKE